ncbi:MAG TPA: glycosyltransferase family A protein [Acidimicrobiales bacterium]|nr:glycosyltransferase family A protein [Acidimicrobiales bacterium]
MISVVLPVRDGLPWLDAQLAALAAQQWDGPWEVVVADNGSADASADLARSWGRRCDRIRVLDASHRSGPAAARNAGVRAARGEMLAFCDADDIVQPGWIAACVAGLADADLVAGSFDMASLNGMTPGAPSAAATDQLGFLPAGLAANLAVRRPAFDAVGGFGEQLFVGEDIDFCWRLQLQGFRFAPAPDAVVAKREPADPWVLFRRALAYGRCGPLLYRRYRQQGARRDLVGSARSWAWLVAALPGLRRRDVRRRWVRALGVRLGRLTGSVAERVFFP